MKAKKIAKILILVLLIATIFIILGASFYAFLTVKDTKLDKSTLESQNTEIVKIKDDNGCEMEYFYNFKSDVPYEKISPYTVYAFVSLEDKRFFTHSGLDYKRIIGASINNIKAGYYKEGGSTITQQLAKNALLTQEKTIKRKLKEAKLSLEIEKNYTKEEIISIYLNTIYFGHSIYGIKEASERLFDKEPAELTISESAILAGIVKNPLKNSPLNSLENAISRRNLVLKLMYEQKYITAHEYQEALQEQYEKPQISEQSKKQNIPYTQVVISEGAKLLGISEKELITNGYEIHTYYREQEQKVLNSAYFSKDLTVDNAEKTFIVANNATGGVSAYISTVNLSPFDYRRQSASTLKPLVSYAPAIEKGLVIPDSPILDQKENFGTYSPHNYQNNYLGWTSIKDSLAVSSNVCSVKLLEMASTDYAFNLLYNLGIELDEKDGLATALGGTTYGQTPIELSRAYMTIANGGVRQDISFIKAIYDRDGKLLYKHDSAQKRVVSNETAYYLTEMLLEVANSGTAKKLSLLPFDVASKTGTCGNADGNYDAWNISFSTLNTVCVWYGSSDYSKPLDLSVSGGSYPTIAAKYIHSCLDTPKNFQAPSSIYSAEIDKYSYDNYHILTLASEKTPIEYRKTITLSENSNITRSTYFEDSLPSDFNVILGDGEVIITLTQNEKFDYDIVNSLGETLYRIKKGSSKCEIALPKPSFGIDTYSVISVTDDGIIVDKSLPRAVLVW